MENINVSGDVSNVSFHVRHSTNQPPSLQTHLWVDINDELDTLIRRDGDDARAVCMGGRKQHAGNQ